MKEAKLHEYVLRSLRLQNLIIIKYIDTIRDSIIDSVYHCTSLVKREQ